MDVYDIRLENLRKVVGELGSQTQLADRLGIDPATLSQILGPARSRNIGARLARRIEAVAEKPMGWLDQVAHTKDGGPRLSDFAARIARAAESLGPGERDTLERVLTALASETPDRARKSRR